MPTNNVGPKVREFFGKYPDKIAQLFSPDGWRKPKHKYAIDNGCFKQFNEKKYLLTLVKSKEFNQPLFITVPDVVGCHDRTLALWKYYYPILKPYEYPLAFVAQDGCELRDVPDTADWIFIGGLNPWKKDNIHKFIGDRPVHVGRVNSLWMLEYCQSLGVTSVDGTGWMRARGKQYYDFINWFEGNPQQKLWVEMGEEDGHKSINNTGS